MTKRFWAGLLMFGMVAASARGAEVAKLPAAGERSAADGIVIFGDLAPVNGVSAKYLAEAVRETNLLRPAAVFTVGGLIPGMTRNMQRYGEEAQAVRAELDQLKMPWYPCAGETDVASGTRVGADRSGEEAYKKLFGPLYYSVDVGGRGGVGGEIHAIVLDSEEQAGRAIGEEQIAWLKADLNKVFVGSESGARKTKWVVVLVHRPLWRMAEAGAGEGGARSWNRVHQLLVDFNRRPIVSVEGGGGGAVSEGPRVAGVWAGDARAYSREPTRDGIRYTVVGATAARIEQDASVAVRHFTLVKLDDADGGVHAALVRLDAGDAIAAIAPEDVVTERERQIMDAIAALPNDALGVEGAVDLSAGAAGPTTEPGATAVSPAKEADALTMLVGNPLDVPLNVQMRLASARNLGTATARENANPFVENFDARWEMDIPHQIRHLEPGAKERWPMKLTLDGAGAGGAGGDASGKLTDAGPAQVEFVVRWTDPRNGVGSGEGSVREVVLKRRVAVVPRAEVPVAEGVEMAGDRGWADAAQGGTYAWEVRSDELQERSPEWQMVADGERIYVRVRVEDGVKSYWPKMALEKKWGGIASDAVAVSWSAESGKTEATRMWVLPFGPKGAEVWRNHGVGAGQSALERVDEKAGVRAVVESRADGYTVTMSMPRTMLFHASGQAIRMNVEVSNNDEGGQTWRRSWASEGGGPALWGRVLIKEIAATAPATRPAK